MSGPRLWIAVVVFFITFIFTKQLFPRFASGPLEPYGRVPKFAPFFHIEEDTFCFRASNFLTASSKSLACKCIVVDRTIINRKIFFLIRRAGWSIIHDNRFGSFILLFLDSKHVFVDEDPAFICGMSTMGIQ